jgi:hypothetical protein
VIDIDIDIDIDTQHGTEPDAAAASSCWLVGVMEPTICRQPGRLAY